MWDIKHIGSGALLAFSIKRYLLGVRILLQFAHDGLAKSSHDTAMKKAPNSRRGEFEE